MIVSFSPGRIRLRFQELKDEGIATLAKERILAAPGIRRVEVKPSTGSLLIEYDPQALSPERLLELGRRELAKFGVELPLPGKRNAVPGTLL